MSSKILNGIKQKFRDLIDHNLLQKMNFLQLYAFPHRVQVKYENAESSASVLFSNLKGLSHQILYVFFAM